MRSTPGCAAARDTVDVQSHLEFLADHPFGVVFWSAFVEAVGVPFPSRVILILTPAFLATGSDLVLLIMMATLGAVLGDHVPYLAGRRAGLRMLGLYCKITLASENCVDRALRYFSRFGAAALPVSRFSTSVRLFASACAGCARITYLRYLGFDTLGTVVYSSLWVLVGSFIGEQAVVFLTTDRRRWLFVGLVVLAAATLIGYRLWRRLRYGGARASSIDTLTGEGK
jgi:membrane protein DedA with SNARE-associated domain